MINDRFTGAEQSRAICTWTAWTGTAFVVGPVLGGIMVDALNWRCIFCVNLVPLIVTLALTTRLAPQPPVTTDRPRVDVVVRASTRWAYRDVFALIEQQRLRWSDPLVLAALALRSVCLAAFPWCELRTDHPMMPPEIFRRRNFAVCNVATVFLYASVSLGMLLVTLFLQETIGLTAIAAALATLPIPVLSFFLRGAVPGARRPLRTAVVHSGRAPAGRGLVCVDDKRAQ